MKYKAIAIAAVVAFIIGSTIGSGLMYKWSMAQESGRLKVALQIKEQERSAALASLKKYYEDLPPVEIIKYETEKVIKYVTVNPECDVSPREQRLLDYSRTGVRLAAPGTDEGAREPGAPQTPKRVPRPVAVRAHVDAAVNYRQCFAVAKAVELYLKKRAEPL